MNNTKHDSSKKDMAGKTSAGRAAFARDAALRSREPHGKGVARASSSASAMPNGDPPNLMLWGLD